jgi:putative DNA methylase
MRVRTALALINQTLTEVLSEQEDEFDSDTRWALAWFEQHGFEPGEFGVAETLSKAKNTSVEGMAEAGILVSRRGKVRLLKPAELRSEGREKRSESNPSHSSLLSPHSSTWLIVHHLIRTLETGGESAAAELVAKLGSKAEVARELAYRLYTICERKKRAAEALAYNGFVQSWPEIARLARETATTPRQAGLFQGQET